MRQVRIQGVIVGHKAGLLRMLKAFETHRLRPWSITGHLRSVKLSGAFEYLESANHIGKVVIQH